MKKIIKPLFCIIIILILTTYSGVVLSISNVFAEPDLAQSSKSALFMDFDSETIVFEKDINKQLPIASMVKMMTILMLIWMVCRYLLIHMCHTKWKIY